MSVPDITHGCQAPCLPSIATGPADVPPQSLLRRLKLSVRRRLSPQAERRFKARTNDAMNRAARITGKPERPAALPVAAAVHLQAGDHVRVRGRRRSTARSTIGGSSRAARSCPRWPSTAGPINGC